MNEKDGGWDLSDLEKEIDSAVDTLLVKKGEEANPVTQPQKTPPHVEEPHAVEQPSPSPSSSPPPPSPSQSPPPQSPPPTRQPDSQVLQDKLEAVEAQLLTLEWDISSKHLNNAITYLQDFRRFSHAGDELEKIIILIQKVLYQLTSDESKLTPTALKFLQKAWKAVKGMTDERFSFEIDKKTLVQELIAEFQNLRMEEKPPKREERIEARPPQETRIEFSEERVIQEPHTEKRLEFSEERVIQEPHTEKSIPFSEFDKFMHKIEQLLHAVSDERRRLEGIHQEIVNFKDELQNSLNAGGDQQKALRHKGIADFEERLSRKSYPPSVSLFLFKVSGVIFGLPEQQIIRSFPIKKWVSEFFIEKGKVKLKNREIPLFNIFQVFKIKPTTEENPHVLLIKGREDRPAAIIIDRAIPREEIEYKPIEGRHYIMGQGTTRSGKVWILDAEQIFP